MSLSGYGTRILELWDIETDTLEEKAMFHRVAMGKLFNDYRRRMIKNNTKSASNIMAVARHLAEGWLSTLQSTAVKANKEELSSRIDEFANLLASVLSPKMVIMICNEAVPPGESTQMRFAVQRSIGKDPHPEVLFPDAGRKRAVSRERYRTPSLSPSTEGKNPKKCMQGEQGEFAPCFSKKCGLHVQ